MDRINRKSIFVVKANALQPSPKTLNLTTSVSIIDEKCQNKTIHGRSKKPKSQRTAVTINIRQSKVCGQRKMPITQRWSPKNAINSKVCSYKKYAKHSKVCGHRKMPETLRTAVKEKCQKLKQQRSQKNDSMSDVLGHSKMSKTQRSTVKEKCHNGLRSKKD